MTDQTHQNTARRTCTKQAKKALNPSKRRRNKRRASRPSKVKVSNGGQKKAKRAPRYRKKPVKVTFDELSTEGSESETAAPKIDKSFKGMKVVVEGELAVDGIIQARVKRTRKLKFACASNLNPPEPQKLALPSFL